MSRILRLAALALVALACAAAPAGAATYSLRPDTDSWNFGWAVTPFGAHGSTALADAVDQPAAPDTTTGYISSTTSGYSAWYGLGTVTLAQGETVTGATLWAYLATGSARSVDMGIWSGWTRLADTTIPAGSAAGWYSVSTATALTQTQVDGLSIRFTPGGSGTSTPVQVYEAYAELDTSDPPPPSDPPPSSPPPSSPPPSTPPTTTVAQAAVKIARAATYAVSSGQIPVGLFCATSKGYCTGTVTLEAPGSPAPSKRFALRAARRAKRVYGRRSYKLAAGTHGRVPVAARRIFRHRIRHRAYLKVDVVVTQKDSSGHTTAYRREIRVRKKRGH